MTIALLFALALSGGEPPPATPASEAPVSAAPVPAQGPDSPIVVAPAPSTGDAPDLAGKTPTREELEDAIPDGAPRDDYGLVAWCHGALAGQVELDSIVEKDMDAIEGKEKAAKRRADDVEIAKEHKRYLALYERALVAAEKASPTAIHQRGVDAELSGYKIWGPTRNKAPIWRMVDWGNWEVPPRCEKAAKQLYDRATLFGEVLTSEATADPTPAPSAASGPTPAAADAPDPGKGAPPPGAPISTSGDLRGPQ